MGSRKLICLLCVLWISGCAGSRMPQGIPDEGKVRDFADIYRRSKESGLSVSEKDAQIRLGPDIGQEKPYYPVYEPPRIVKVWVPAHLPGQDRRVLVAGHWTFLMVQDPRWYIEEHMGEGDFSPQVPFFPVKEAL